MIREESGRRSGGIKDIRHLLNVARTNLDLDVAFIAQFVGDKRLVKLVDTAGDHDGLREGEKTPSSATYCRLLADGLIPGAIRDTHQNAVVCALPVTTKLPIGAHLGVPIRMSDGTTFGTFCCFAHKARPSLNDHDLAILKAFAEITARYIEDGLFADRHEAEKEHRINDMLLSAGPQIVYQPVFMLDNLRIAGAEALSRFPDGGQRAVDAWFRDAADIGLQVELEMLAIRNSLLGFQPIWQRHRVQLGLNVSAATITDDRLWTALEGCPRDLIVFELTEHEEVRNYAALLNAANRFRQAGTKIAVDDVGAGYASMRHVLTVRPDILKLDIGLTRDIDSDDLRAALTSSLKHFADRFDCRIVAEGVETREELAMLQDLGVQAAQGYLLGRPAPAEALLAMLDGAASRATHVMDERVP